MASVASGSRGSSTRLRPLDTTDMFDNADMELSDSRAVRGHLTSPLPRVPASQDTQNRSGPPPAVLVGGEQQEQEGSEVERKKGAKGKGDLQHRVTWTGSAAGSERALERVESAGNHLSVDEQGRSFSGRRWLPEASTSLRSQASSNGRSSAATGERCGVVMWCKLLPKHVLHGS